MSRAGRGRATPRGSEAGAVMMFVLMAILLVGAVTLSVMQVLTADVTGGVEQLEADQVFNIAQAGVHYAIGQLELSGGSTYAGETTPITNGSTTLGTATIVVNCIDSGASPNPNGCPGSYPGYRRIISTGTLPVAGPARKIVAIVQATTGAGTYAFCGMQSVALQDPGDPTTIYGDIGSNGNITISTNNNAPGVYTVAADPNNTPPQFQGIAKANGTITCASGCASQVQGGVFPGWSGTVCSPPPPPTYAPGTTPVNISGGTVFTINSTTGYSFGDINLAASTTNGQSGNCNWNELQIKANPNAGDPPITVNIRSLSMGGCTRLAVIGNGPVNLLIAGTIPGTNTGLYAGGTTGTPIHFGVEQNVDQWNKPAPLPAGQLTIWINSNNMTCSSGGAPPPPSCAGMISHSTGSATIYVPNGSFNFDDSLGSLGEIFNGQVVANQVLVTGWNNINVGSSSTSSWSTFNRLLSWKDQ